MTTKTKKTTPKATASSGAIATLRARATREPGVTEDIACKGTALESTTFKLGGQAFLFVQPKDGGYVVRLKLEQSLREAKRAGHDVGANGWVKLTFAPPDPPDVPERWLAESRHLVTKPAPTRSAPKKRAR